jgi:hypothetical protein
MWGLPNEGASVKGLFGDGVSGISSCAGPPVAGWACPGVSGITSFTSAPCSPTASPDRFGRGLVRSTTSGLAARPPAVCDPCEERAFGQCEKRRTRDGEVCIAGQNPGRPHAKVYRVSEHPWHSQKGSAGAILTCEELFGSPSRHSATWSSTASEHRNLKDRPQRLHSFSAGPMPVRYLHKREISASRHKSTRGFPVRRADHERAFNLTPKKYDSWFWFDQWGT